MTDIDPLALADRLTRFHYEGSDPDILDMVDGMHEAARFLRDVVPQMEAEIKRNREQIAQHVLYYSDLEKQLADKDERILRDVVPQARLAIVGALTYFGMDEDPTDPVCVKTMDDLRAALDALQEKDGG